MFQYFFNALVIILSMLYLFDEYNERYGADEEYVENKKYQDFYGVVSNSPYDPICYISISKYLAETTTVTTEKGFRSLIVAAFVSNMKCYNDRKSNKICEDLIREGRIASCCYVTYDGITSYSAVMHENSVYVGGISLEPFNMSIQTREPFKNYDIYLNLYSCANTLDWGRIDFPYTT